jgi:DNA-binding beta-propeller fold protein YncE
MVACLAVATAFVFSSGSRREIARTENIGSDRIVSWDALPAMPTMDEAMCPWLPATMPASASMTMAAALQGGAGTPVTAQATGERIDRDPLRVIRDPYPSYSVVAMDVERGEVIAGDENLFQILVYDRTANTPPGAAFTEPKRVIAGPATGIEFVCGLYVDQPSGDIYAIHADTAAVMQVFSREKAGNVPPTRELHTGSEARGRGFAVDAERQELFIASQHNSAVAVWRKLAEGEEPPIRLLQGDRTRLANPTGMAYYKPKGQLFVANHGQVSSRTTDRPNSDNRPLGTRAAVPGSGRFVEPSVNVYDRAASGDTPPLRVIQGPKTQLNWPAAIAVDERNGELFVANDIGDSVLVFAADAAGDVAPIRAIKGPLTLMDGPSGVYVDTKNNEVWVANYGNHTMTVFAPNADGNVAPKRVIRSGPSGTRSLMIGNPGALAYDTKREEILAPN